jgi:AcrR family transcriptional regulator
MARVGAPKGRPHDARRAQAAILDAAEMVFAEHGFDGARVDAIAEAAGYNKSLIFHYFDDKLGLYTAVLKRADQQGLEMQARLFGSLSLDATLSADAFRAFVERTVKETFEYFVEHPRLLRMIAWEEAEGWTTLAKIYSQLDQSDVERFNAVLEQAQRAGVLRPDVAPRLFLLIVMNVCRTYMTSLPMFQMVAPGEELATPEALARARQQITAFVVHGLIADP